MKDLSLTKPLDADLELTSLFEYNGIKTVMEGKKYRFLLSYQGIKWETVCEPTDDGAVMIYSIYPFIVLDENKAIEFCNRINNQARYGSMIYQDKRIAFRMGADLFDEYTAYETLGRALEYSAGIIARFWVQAFTIVKDVSK